MVQDEDFQKELDQTILWAYKSMQTFIKEHKKICTSLSVDLDFNQITESPEDEEELNERYSKAMDILKSASHFATIMQATIQRQYLWIQEEEQTSVQK